MSLITDSPEPAVQPVAVDLDLESTTRECDLLLDGEMDADALARLKALSARRSALESLHRRTGWTRFYQDSRGSVHVDRDCYAAAPGIRKMLPEMSGKELPQVREVYGPGRTCKMCSHGMG